MLHNRQVILLKVEGTYNVDPTPVEGVDAILVENLAVADANVRLIDRPVLEASLGTRASIFGGRMKTVTFDVEVKGSGVAGTAPEIGQALRGCGFGETIVGGVSVTYEPVSTGAESITMWRYLDGILEKFTGSRGEVSFNYETGNKIMASFSFTGHFASGADIAVASPSYNATLPVAILGASFVVGGYAAVINALSFAMTNTLAIAPDMNAADGFGEVNITKRDVQGSFDPETVLLAVNNFDTDFTGNVVMALATGALGGTAGNILNTSMPAIKYQSKAEGERDGVQTYDMGFKAAPSAGDDDVTLAFT